MIRERIIERVTRREPFHVRALGVPTETGRRRRAAGSRVSPGRTYDRDIGFGPLRPVDRPYDVTPVRG